MIRVTFKDGTTELHTKESYLEMYKVRGDQVKGVRMEENNG